LAAVGKEILGRGWFWQASQQTTDIMDWKTQLLPQSSACLV